MGLRVQSEQRAQRFEIKDPTKMTHAKTAPVKRGLGPWAPSKHTQNHSQHDDGALMAMVRVILVRVSESRVQSAKRTTS